VVLHQEEASARIGAQAEKLLPRLPRRRPGLSWRGLYKAAAGGVTLAGDAGSVTGLGAGWVCVGIDPA